MKKLFSQPVDDEAIAEMAAHWLAVREAGLSREQTKEFKRWRRADPRHESAVARMEETCGILEKMPLLAQVSRAGRETELNRLEAGAATMTPFPLRKIAIGLAAGFLAMIAGWQVWPRSSDFAQDYATSTERRQNIDLPDGTVVALNRESEIHVRYHPGQREVTLTKGEAHFNVAKNPARPFLVTAGDVVFRAVGTAFDVNLAATKVELLVTEGRVQVNPGSGSATSVSAGGAAPPPVLTAGEHAVIELRGSGEDPEPRVDVLEPAAIRKVLAWKTPWLEFNNTPLSEVVSQFNRHNRIQLIVGELELANRPVGGNFRSDEVLTFLRLLEDGHEIAAERRGDFEIVLHKAK